MKRLLITGSGRSGTGYMAHVMRACGLTCGHEDVFDDVRADPAVPYQWGRRWDAESSWLAVPRLPLVGPVVVQVVRDPLRVVKSHVDFGFFQSDTDYTRCVYRLFPDVIYEQTPQDRVLAYWVQWNVRVGLYAHRRYQVEKFGPAALADILRLIGWEDVPDLAAALATVPTDVNNKAADKFDDWTGGWDSFRPALGRAGRQLAVSYGYETG